MYPLAILLDPKRMESMQPVLTNEQYNDLNERLWHIADTYIGPDGKVGEDPDLGFRYGDITDLDEATPVEAQDSVESLIEFIEGLRKEHAMDAVREEAIEEGVDAAFRERVKRLD